jgi:hypothetical protein
MALLVNLDQVGMTIDMLWFPLRSDQSVLIIASLIIQLLLE